LQSPGCYSTIANIIVFSIIAKMFVVIFTINSITTGIGITYKLVILNDASILSMNGNG